MAKTAPLVANVTPIHSRWSRVSKRLHHLHASHRGSYSTERLIALETFCRQASFLRVVAVFIMFPLPTLAIAIAIESIPLRDRNEGWQANYVAFIRYMMSCSAIGVGCVLQMRQLIPGIQLSMGKVVCIGVGAATISTLVMLLISSRWVFPVPFGDLLVVPVFVISIICLFLLSLDMQQRASPEFARLLKAQVSIIGVQSIMSLTYPVFSTVYEALSPTGKMFFVVLLPIIKLVMQNCLVWASAHLVEYIVGITVFSAEAFNALYMSKCMQSGSFMTYLVIMAFDILKSLLAFRDMLTQSAYVQQLMRYCILTDRNRNLLRALVELCSQPGATDNSVVHIRSPISLRLSENDKELLY